MRPPSSVGRPQSGGGSVLALAVLLVIQASSVARAGESSFEDRAVGDTGATLQGSLDRAIEERERVQSLFPRLKNLLARYPNFIADTEVRLDFRTFGFALRNRPGDDAQAWAAGGKIAYRSGWYREQLQIGAGVYTSLPVVADDPNALTELLRPGERGFAVFGEAFVKGRFRSAEFTLGRQEINLPYVNRNDSRMAPNSFQGIFSKGIARGVPVLNRIDWTAAWITDIRPRNENSFQSMAERAGAKGADDGMGVAGVQFRPTSWLSIGAYNYYVPNTFNTAYLATDATWKLGADLSLQFEAQMTQQASVGAEQIGDFSTWVGDARAALTFRALTGWVAASRTGSDSGIRSPYGSYPGLVSLMQSDFNAAGETAWVVGVAAAPKLWPNWSGFMQLARGTGGFDPRSGAMGVAEQEIDMTVDYRRKTGKWQGLWFRVRGSYLESDAVDKPAWQVRLILNYTLPVL